MTKADSKLEAIEALRENNLHVMNIVVCVDREQGGTAELTRLGYTVRSVLKVTGMIRYYADQKLITTEQRDMSLAYLRANAT